MLLGLRRYSINILDSIELNFDRFEGHHHTHFPEVFWNVNSLLLQNTLFFHAHSHLARLRVTKEKDSKGNCTA